MDGPVSSRCHLPEKKLLNILTTRAALHKLSFSHARVPSLSRHLPRSYSPRALRRGSVNGPPSRWQAACPGPRRSSSLLPPAPPVYRFPVRLSSP
eukprot:scaffold143642_cov32-Tisochrysis_lutea.AAC.2